MPTPQDWQTIIQAFGVPLAVMLVLFYAIRAVAKWLAPRADNLITAHTTFLNSVSESVRDLGKAVGDVHDDVRHVKDKVSKCDRQ